MPESEANLPLWLQTAVALLTGMGVPSAIGALWRRLVPQVSTEAEKDQIQLANAQHLEDVRRVMFEELRGDIDRLDKKLEIAEGANQKLREELSVAHRELSRARVKLAALEERVRHQDARDDTLARVEE